MHFYAADLARAPDGRWWVVGDRTDAPLGWGYALENRIVTSRMLPNAIRNFHIERLAPFFKMLQETLRELAPAHRDNPRIVLLSHGPSGPNYFEDAFLARYLGYTLVEGGDLAVRDNHVYMKTLAGLLPVDVILRRLSDEFCDPLELRSEAGLGVPGLLQAARLGHVAIVEPARKFAGRVSVVDPVPAGDRPGVARRRTGVAVRRDLVVRPGKPPGRMSAANRAEGFRPAVAAAGVSVWPERNPVCESLRGQNSAGTRNSY